MEILAQLLHFLFSLDGKLAASPIVFVLGCASFGCIIVLLDWLTFRATGRSYLKLVHGGRRTVVFLIIWGLGAGVGGYLGAAFGILKLSLGGAIAAGVGWPLILPRVIRSARIDLEEEEQPIETEEDD